MSSRMSSSARKTKVITLLSMYPRSFSIKEIIEYYGSLGIHLNRNSLRKTLDELVTTGRIKATKASADKKGRRYYLGEIADIYRKIAETVSDKQSLLNIGYNLTPTIQFETNHEGKSLVDILNTNLIQLMIHYPFMSVEHGENGGLRVKSRFEVIPIDDHSATIRVSPCLCKGEEAYSNACSIVAGSLKRFTTGVLDPSVNVRWSNKRRGDNPACEFTVEVKIKVAQQLGIKRVDLDDPAERERVIPGL